MKSIFYKISFFSFLAILFFSCSDTKTTSKKENTQPKVSKPVLPVPDFNADSAYTFVEEQVAFGPRVPNTMQHQLCGDYLVEQLKSFGWEVIEQTFETEAYDGTMLKGRNIIGSFNPEVRKRVLLSSHWDSRHVADQEEIAEPILGANDGASGVGVLLEMARLIGADTIKPQMGIDILFFDVEDYGAPSGAENVSDRQITYCLGSQYWTENLHKEGYHAYYGVLLDMVGAKGARFTKEGHSRQFAPKVVDKIWDKAAELGYGAYFVNENTEAIVDDHYIVNLQSSITMIDIIHHDRVYDNPFFEHWHRTTDNMDAIDKNSLKAVGQTLLHVVYNDII